MRNFSNFLGTRDRENKKHLETLGIILNKAGFHVSNHTDNHSDPYVFVRKPGELSAVIESLTFEGVRVYTRGKSTVCFRVANKPETEPYGVAYQLDISGMFRDLLGEMHKKNLVGHELAKYIIEEFKNFFIESAKAEKSDPEFEPMGSAIVGGSGTDYSNTVTNSNRQ